MKSSASFQQTNLIQLMIKIVNWNAISNNDSQSHIFFL